MTPRLQARFAIGALAAAAAAGGVASLVRWPGGAFTRGVMAAVEPATQIAFAKAGGTVSEVLARAGDRVRKEQPLVRFEAAALLGRRAEVAAALESAKGLSTIPRPAIALAVDAHPDVLAAEEEYTRALSAFEQAPAEQRAALARAAAARTEARQRIGRSLAKSTADLSNTTATLEDLLRELDRAIAEREVRAPADGIVDLLDLHPGDRIVPGAPAATVVIPGEYACEFTLPSAAGLRPGTALRAVAAGRAPVVARVERVSTRAIPSALRENRAAAEETVVRARFSLAAPLAPGAPVRLELP